MNTQGRIALGRKAGGTGCYINNVEYVKVDHMRDLCICISVYESVLVFLIDHDIILYKQMIESCDASVHIN